MVRAAMNHCRVTSIGSTYLGAVFIPSPGSICNWVNLLGNPLKTLEINWAENLSINPGITVV